MHGHLWLSLVKVREGVDEQRPAGMYGVAMVAYAEPSPLTYGELLVGRVVKEPVQGVTITDIWVDSAASVAGGRAIWAIPKQLCDFTSELTRRGPLARSEWRMSTGGIEIARAAFSDVSRLAPRTPFKANTWQPGIAETSFEDRSSPLTGSGKALPARGRWRFNPDGPLGWLHGSRPVGSFAMADFSMVVH
jgi:acetoacetate decarboxylase